MKDYAVTDKNAISLYFQSLQGTGGMRVIDLGCFLKRIGALSRTVLDLSIPEDTYLVGVDIPSSSDLPIYENIYDEIRTDLPGMHFAIGLLLCPEGVYTKEETKKYLSWCRVHCDRVITWTGRHV